MKLTCSTCGLAMPEANVNLAKGVYFCPRCVKSFVFTTAELSATADEPNPAASAVEFAGDADALSLTIRRGNHSQLRHHAIAMAVFVNACTAVFIACGLLPGIRLPLAGAGALVVTGLAAAFVALFLARGEFTLAIDHRECVATWILYRCRITRRVPTSGITDVLEHEVFSSKGRRRYAIRIKHPRSDILFGATLGDEERPRILAELRRFLRLPAIVRPSAAVSA